MYCDGEYRIRSRIRESATLRRACSASKNRVHDIAMTNYRRSTYIDE